jgi:hypothetical protein
VRRGSRLPVSVDQVHAFVEQLFGDDMHAMRVLSLVNATVGAIAAGALAVTTIGLALAHLRGLDPKHAVKQVDRLLSNNKVDVWALFAYWVPYILASRTEVFVAMDWTEFDADGHSTIAINLVTKHGRATPLVWKTVRKSELRGKRGRYEREVLERFAELLPEGVKATVLADRGFGDQKLYQFLADVELDFVIRFRGDIWVTVEGEKRLAADWVGKGGRARRFRHAEVTGMHTYVPTVICVHAKGMKEPWCLASSREDLKTREFINLYGKRWGIECAFRDTKDPRFGMGLYATRIKQPERRDRVLLISALAVALLTVLGEAGESLGLDRILKSNTVKTRTHSLYRQGCMLYLLLPTMREDRLEALVERFYEKLREHRVFQEVYGVL